MLERAHRRAGGRHPRSEGVAELVERDPVDVRAVDRLLEAAHELRSVERLAGVGMAEDEIAVARVDGLRAQLAERQSHSLGHRDRPARASRLRIAELAADVRGDDSDLARVEVDVAPAQTEQLTLAQSGHRRRQVERRLDPAERVGGIGRGKELFELGLVEELDPRLGFLHCRPIGELHRVRRAPALPQTQVEDRVHRVDVVADRLDRERPPLRGHVALDVRRPDAIEGLAAEERRDVVAR